MVLLMDQDFNDNTYNVISNSAEVVAAVAAARDQAWVRSNLSLLTKLLEKIWVYDDTTLHEVVSPLTERMLREVPETDSVDVPPDARALLALVENAVTEGLTASQRSSQPTPGTLFLLRHWLTSQPTLLQNEALSSALLKVLANLVKVLTNNGPDTSTRLIINILNLLRGRVSDLREHRRHFQSILSTLIEKDASVQLSRYILDFMREWILRDPDMTSQSKEKATLLLKMAVFESRDEALFQSYLDLIYDIYETDVLKGTDLTHRLEQAFLYGTMSKSPEQRNRFLDKLEYSLPGALDKRLEQLCVLQNWETLANVYWIPQILSMLLAVTDTEASIMRRALPPVSPGDALTRMSNDAAVDHIIQPLRNLIHRDVALAHRTWVDVFAIAWSALSRAQQATCTPFLIKLLAKPFHNRQCELRPNVIQTFLEGVLVASPTITLPPAMVKWLAKMFNAWYTGYEMLNNLCNVCIGDEALHTSCIKSLRDLYADLCETDMYYGVVRNRCAFPETIGGLSYEQNGNWPRAIEMYEGAMIKARNSQLPFVEEEYVLWEDHWISAAQKLQQWESIVDLGRHGGDDDLLLECAWRLTDWSTSDRDQIDTHIAAVVDQPTPRRKTFEAFNVLLKAHNARETPNDFLRVIDEAQQVTLKKWVSLPSHMTSAHLPLLQMFQQCVELNEAALVFDSLQMTNQSNLELRVNSDLKQIFQTWRDRLPNFWDDIAVWSDLLAWRLHIFAAVTRVFHPLIPPGETATYGYRGHHETAWMINRFGEVARRHGLLDVCSVQLNKIYSLPNIEISEAFLKLREQALCFFQKPDRFNEGLENISTTNLMYFAPSQKAEFLTLKGMFISKLGQNEEANAEFAHAISIDMTLSKAWAEWGRFNDKLYRERSESVPHPIPEPEPGKQRMTEQEWAERYARDRAVLASSAVSCYMQAAGLYANHKSRGLLLRVLWLLGLDDNQNTIAKAFDSYKSDHVIWYWITLIPQLILSLSHREAKQARLLLARIAKMYPQVCNDM